MTILYIFEIFLYELIDLFPNLILALLPFRNFMRFPAKYNVCFVLLLYVLVTCTRILALNNLPAATLFTTVWILFYLLFYMVCIRCQVTKLLFVLLNILNYGSFVVILNSYFIHLKASFTERPYSLSSSFILLLIYLFSYPVIYQLIIKKVKALIEFPENNKVWRFLWLVPATFCLAYYYNLFTNGGIDQYSSRLSNVLFAACFNLGALFVTFLVIRLLSESNDSLRLKAENYQLNMQAIQYEHLQTRMEDARRASHDLRQNLTVIQSYLQDNNIECLSHYINQYLSSLPPTSPILYCDNYALNALIVYYENAAQEHGIRFHAEVEYPSGLNITDSDAAVLFGNMIENAVDACIRQRHKERFIELHMKLLNSILVITLDNSYEGAIQKTGNSFLSSKSKRTGIGTFSIRRIAEKYKGTTSFDFDGSVFHASVMLNLGTGGQPASLPQ